MQGIYENRYARFWIADGILRFEYREGIVINLAAARSVVADRLYFQNERVLPVLCDSRGVAAIDKAARDYLASAGSLLAKGVALLVRENVSQVMSRFYLQVSKPAVPTEIFTKEREALSYLSSFLS